MVRQDYEIIPKSINIYIKTILQFVTVFLVLLALNFFAFGFCYDVSIVSGESMLPTLNNGTIDEVYIYKFAKLKVGNIVVVDNEAVDKDIIKRVVGVSGDRLKIKADQSGKYYLYRNGEKQEETFIYSRDAMAVTYSKFYKLLSESEHEENVATDEHGDLCYVVPNNAVFVLGDNRGNSLDSSYFGAFSLDSVVGRVDYIVESGTDYNLFVLCKFLGIV